MLELADGSQQQDRPFERAEFGDCVCQRFVAMAQNAFRFAEESLNERLVNSLLPNFLACRLVRECLAPLAMKRAITGINLQIQVAKNPPPKIRPFCVQLKSRYALLTASCSTSYTAFGSRTLRRQYATSAALSGSKCWRNRAARSSFGLAKSRPSAWVQRDISSDVKILAARFIAEKLESNDWPS